MTHGKESDFLHFLPRKLTKDWKKCSVPVIQCACVRQLARWARSWCCVFWINPSRCGKMIDEKSRVLRLAGRLQSVAALPASYPFPTLTPCFCNSRKNNNRNLNRNDVTPQDSQLCSNLFAITKSISLIWTSVMAVTAYYQMKFFSTASLSSQIKKIIGS